MDKFKFSLIFDDGREIEGTITAIDSDDALDTLESLFSDVVDKRSGTFSVGGKAE